MLKTVPMRAASTMALALVLSTAAASTPAHADDTGFLRAVECGTTGGPGCQIILTWLFEQEGFGQGGGGSQAPGGSAPGGSEDDIDWDALDIDWDELDYGEDEDEQSDPFTLVRESLASFDLPSPRIVSSPAPDSLVLVNTPLWLWVESSEWQSESATAELDSWSLTVTATPVRTLWSMGEGTTVECEGPGTPYDPDTHDPAAESPDCGHVYRVSSDDSPGGTHTVTVQVLWDTGWSFSDGDSGSLNQLISTSQAELTVRESHGLVVDTGSH